MSFASKYIFVASTIVAAALLPACAALSPATETVPQEGIFSGSSNLESPYIIDGMSDDSDDSDSGFIDPPFRSILGEPSDGVVIDWPTDNAHASRHGLDRTALSALPVNDARDLGR